MTYDEGFAAGMRRAAEIANLHAGADITDCKDAGEGYDQAAFDICSAILAAIPASAPWTPPPEAERPEGFECLGRGVKGSSWHHIQWNNGRWWLRSPGIQAFGLVAFAPLPPTPEAQP